MDVQAGGDDVSALEVALAPLEIADRASGLAHQQAAGGHVPGRQRHLPESVITAARDVSECERGRSVASDPGRAQDKRSERREVLVEAIERPEWKAGDQQRLGQL